MSIAYIEHINNEKIEKYKANVKLNTKRQKPVKIHKNGPLCGKFTS